MCLAVRQASTVQVHHSCLASALGSQCFWIVSSSWQHPKDPAAAPHHPPPSHNTFAMAEGCAGGASPAARPQAAWAKAVHTKVRAPVAGPTTTARECRGPLPDTPRMWAPISSTDALPLLLSRCTLTLLVEVHTHSAFVEVHAHSAFVEGHTGPVWKSRLPLFALPRPPQTSGLVISQEVTLLECMHAHA